MFLALVMAARKMKKPPVRAVEICMVLTLQSKNARTMG
jgi:hypothetical protein